MYDLRKQLNMKYFFIPLMLLFVHQATAQKYFTRNGNISFFSETPIENIQAHNYKATCVLDKETNKIQWAVLIKAFQFEKALMQEHFNENYMESSKYPKSSFEGEIVGLSDLDLSKDGTYEMTAKGELTIHGVTKNIETPVTLTVNKGSFEGVSEFSVTIADYGIEVPSVVRENIAKVVEVMVSADFQELK